LQIIAALGAGESQSVGLDDPVEGVGDIPALGPYCEQDRQCTAGRAEQIAQDDRQDDDVLLRSEVQENSTLLRYISVVLPD